jgi:hypothetical protein
MKTGKEQRQSVDGKKGRRQERKKGAREPGNQGEMDSRKMK